METLCHDIYPARPMTTVSLAANTYCMMDDWPGIQQLCYQWFKQRLILSVSELSISQRSQIKEDTVKPSVPAREFNLKAYTAIT